jgi:hypothetical protein
MCGRIMGPTPYSVVVNIISARQEDTTDSICSSVPITSSDIAHVDSVPMHTHTLLKHCITYANHTSKCVSYFTSSTLYSGKRSIKPHLSIEIKPFGLSHTHHHGGNIAWCREGVKNMRHVMFFTHHKCMLDHEKSPHSTVNGMYYAPSRDRDVTCPRPETIRTAGMWGNFSPQ